MCIYCGTTKYRKIYENHYDPIPKDETGRTYDIHHIDGNRKNNKPENLKAVTIQEHYDIHYAQRDWSACHRIATKMNLSHEHLSELTKLHNKKMVENGTHPFLGGELQRKQIEEGTHPTQQEWKCEYCDKVGKGRSNYHRYHGMNYIYA
jgi:hypothetical protein